MPEPTGVTGLAPAALRGRRLAGRVGHAAFWIGMWAVALAALLYLLLPTLIIVFASFTAGEYITFPPQGLSLRWFVRLLALEELRVTAWRSLFVAIPATPASPVLAL